MEKLVKRELGIKANVGDGEEQFDLEGGYVGTQPISKSNFCFLNKMTKIMMQQEVDMASFSNLSINNNNHNNNVQGSATLTWCLFLRFVE